MANKAKSRTGNKTKIFIKRPTSADWVLIKDAKNSTPPDQPKQTAEDEYLDEVDGITESVKTGGRDGGEITFEVGVKTENDPGLIAILASKEVDSEEAAIKTVYADGSGWMVERVLLYKVTPKQAKKNEVLGYDVAGKCNSILIPIEDDEAEV